MDKKKSLRVEDRKTGIEEVLADLEREKTPTEQTCAWWLDISKKNWSSFFRQIFSWTKEYSICGIFGWLRDKQGIESKCDPISCWVAQSMTDLRNLTKNFNLRRTNQPISSNIQYPISSNIKLCCAIYERPEDTLILQKSNLIHCIHHPISNIQ